MSIFYAWGKQLNRYVMFRRVDYITDATSADQFPCSPLSPEQCESTFSIPFKCGLVTYF